MEIRNPHSFKLNALILEVIAEEVKGVSIRLTVHIVNVKKNDCRGNYGTRFPHRGSR